MLRIAKDGTQPPKHLESEGKSQLARSGLGILGATSNKVGSLVSLDSSQGGVKD